MSSSAAEETEEHREGAIDALVTWYEDKYPTKDGALNISNYDVRFSLLFSQAQSYAFLKKWYPEDVVAGSPPTSGEPEEEAKKRNSRSRALIVKQKATAEEAMEKVKEGLDKTELEDLEKALGSDERKAAKAKKEECFGKEDMPTITADMIASQVPSILSAMNIGQCMTAGGQVNLAMPPINASMEISIACEQISVMAQKSLEAMNVSQCMLTSVLNSDSSQTDISQNVTVEIGTGAHLECGDGGINLSNVSKATIVTESTLTTSLQREVNMTVKNYIQQAFAFMQDAKKGYLSTPPGQKAVNDALNAIETNYTDVQSNDINNEVSKFTKVGQSVKFSLGRDSVVTGGSCNFSNDSTLNVSAKTVVDSRFKNVLSIDKVTDLSTAMDGSQASKSEGAAAMLKAMSVMVVAGIVGLTLVFVTFFKYIGMPFIKGTFAVASDGVNVVPNALGGQGGRAMIVGLIVLVVLAGAAVGGYFLYKHFKKTYDPASQCVAWGNTETVPEVPGENFCPNKCDIWAVPEDKAAKDGKNWCPEACRQWHGKERPAEKTVVWCEESCKPWLSDDEKSATDLGAGEKWCPSACEGWANATKATDSKVNWCPHRCSPWVGATKPASGGSAWCPDACTPWVDLKAKFSAVKREKAAAAARSEDYVEPNFCPDRCVSWVGKEGDNPPDTVSSEPEYTMWCDSPCKPWANLEERDKIEDVDNTPCPDVCTPWTDGMESDKSSNNKVIWCAKSCNEWKTPETKAEHKDLWFKDTNASSNSDSDKQYENEANWCPIPCTVYTAQGNAHPTPPKGTTTMWCSG